MNKEQEIRWLLEEKYKGQLTSEAKKDIGKLKKGVPLDYLIGNKPFLNTIIDLRFHPLIPRPETEFWTEKLIQEIKKYPPQKTSTLDIFAGSGCIGIALLKNIPWLTVDFGEKSKKFIQQIKINLQLNHIAPARYHLIQSNIFQNIKKKYGIIVANPPYLSQGRKNLIQKEVLKFEPLSALFAQENGLFFIRQFINQVRHYLLPKGFFYLEFDSWQKEPIQKMLIRAGFAHSKFYYDQYHQWRYVRGEYSTREFPKPVNGPTLSQ